MFLLSLGEDQIGEDKGRNHGEERLSDPPENIGQTLSNILKWYLDMKHEAHPERLLQQRLSAP